jgi:hypothetical protein
VQFRWPNSVDGRWSATAIRLLSNSSVKRQSSSSALWKALFAVLVAAPTFHHSVGAASPVADKRSFKLGPLMLGMTNAEVVKLLPMKDCSPEGAAMKCTVEVTALGEKRPLYLSFAIATKRLRKMELLTPHINTFDRERLDRKDARVPHLLSDLGIEPCPSEMEQKKSGYSPSVKCWLCRIVEGRRIFSSRA